MTYSNKYYTAMKCLAIILFFSTTNILSNCQNVSDEEISYYENLITDGIAASRTYQFPTNAENYTSNSSVKDYGTYDYIIIGSGSAGSVIASRLSEITGMSILVIEAGNFDNNFTDIPEMNFYTPSSFYSWGFSTVSQNNSCLGKPNNTCSVPRGRGFGGSSIINGQVYSRGEKRDYDRWGAENKGWDYTTVLKYFKKSENSQIFTNDDYHSSGGPVNVEYSTFHSQILQAFLDGNQELGINVTDYNGENILGVSKTQFTTIHGRRGSTGKYFIRPAQNRSNLHLSSYSYATKIDINHHTKTANAVYFSKNKQNYKAKARREIILSAGAIMSPHILMLSGVGPKNHLIKNKIKVIKNLQVGRNYKDHPTYFGINLLTNASIPIKSLRDYIDDYLHGTGIYTLPSNGLGVGFYKTNNNTYHLADIELLLISPNRSISTLGFNEETQTALNENIDNIATTGAIEVVLLHEQSTGTIELKTNNPFEYPLISSNFYTDVNNVDIETMYRGIKLVLEILETDAFKKINGSLGKVVVPACSSIEYLSKEFWLCSIKQMTDTGVHPMGTCAMGQHPAKGAVVDNKLKVHGIKKLRVADASVIPYPISAHTNAPCIMIGEYASDLIKEDIIKS